MPTILVDDDPLSAAEVVKELAPSDSMWCSPAGFAEWTQAPRKPNTSWAWAE